MAARRLIIVLTVLLGLSIAAAAIAPERRSTLGGGNERRTETTTEPKPASIPPGGGLVERSVEASVEKPPTVSVGVGDQLVLEVESPGAPRQVAIEPLGLLAYADLDAPARFDLLIRRDGDLPVTDAETGKILARILVGEA